MHQLRTLKQYQNRMAATLCKSKAAGASGTLDHSKTLKMAGQSKLATDKEAIVLDGSSNATGSEASEDEPEVAPVKRQTRAKGKAKALEVDANVVQFDPQELEQARTALLYWYDSDHRVLPWRRTPCSTRTTPAPAGPHEAAEPAPADLDPQQFAYYVWVSEIMLQQTQVATVIPYFQKWISRWPRVSDLAAADVEQVNTMWAGLGYYRRARYLLDGAQHVMQQLGGQFPTTAKGMLSIPGVGPYTSAAVASIAFGDPAAVVDGNVIRVVSRLKALAGDPAAHTAAHNLIAQQLLHTGRPGDFNQAVMELGARVCRPQAPDCAACPIASICSAFKTWQAYVEDGGCPDVEDAPQVTNYPGKKTVKAKKEQLVAVCVLEVVQRSAAANDGGSQGGSSKQSGVKGGSSAGAAGGGGKQGQGSGGGGGSDAAGVGQKSKRQASMFDFMSSKVSKVPGAGDVSSAKPSTAAAGKQQEAAAGAGPAQDEVVLPPHVVAGLLADASKRQVLLVQRPAEGLLGGLWEFPSVMLSEEVASTQRRSLINDRLCELLGPGVTIPGITPPPAAATAAAPGVKAQVVRRHDADSYVHVFSHIRQTNFVERVVLAVDDLATFLAAASSQAVGGTAADTPPGAAAVSGGDGPSGGGSKVSGKTGKKGKGAADAGGADGVAEPAPATRWVRASELKAEGLSTGPTKMYAQAVGGTVAGGKGKAGKQKQAGKKA